MGDFEKDLRNAFDEVEFAPSERVWDGVQAGLAPKKKKGVFMMWQTYGIAATLLFLLTMGFLFREELFYSSPADGPTRELTENDNEKSPQTQNDTPEEQQADDPAQSPDTEDIELVDNASDLTVKDLQAQNTTKATSPGDEQSAGQVGLQTAGTNPVNAQANVNGLSIINPEMADVDLLINTEVDLLSLLARTESLAPVRAKWELDNMVGAMEIGLKEGMEEPEATDRLTSLNGSLGSGSFNPNGSLDDAGVANAEALDFDDSRFNASRTVENSDERQLGSIAVGFGVGLPLGERWVFKTGLRYAQYRFASTSNAYSVENGQQLPIYSRVAFDDTQVLFAGDYELTNTLHSISIPAQFGLKVLNFNRFSTWVNMGVAADYFVNYTVKGDLNFLETRTVDFASSDFLSRFNMNILSGVELSYQLNQKFMLSGEVFYRQYIPIGGSTADGVSNATPSFFGFGLGVNFFLQKKD